MPFGQRNPNKSLTNIVNRSVALPTIIPVSSTAENSPRAHNIDDYEELNQLTNQQITLDEVRIDQMSNESDSSQNFESTIKRRTTKKTEPVSMMNDRFKETGRLTMTQKSFQNVACQDMSWKGYPIKWLVQEIKNKKQAKQPLEFDRIGFQGCSWNSLK